MEYPYMSCPFMSQYPGSMYSPQSAGFLGQQYTQPLTQAQQTLPFQQVMPLGYQAQPSYAADEDDDTDYVSPMALAQQDPPPILSNNPAVASVSLFKELTGYPNYGNPSRNADILYTGNRGSWTFQSPAFLTVPGNLRTQLIIRAVLDDHANVPVNRYSARITVNGTVVHDGRLFLEHGVPVGGIFNNWRELPFNIVNPRRTNRVTIENTSNAGADDWIAFDWMEIRSTPR